MHGLSSTLDDGDGWSLNSSKISQPKDSVESQEAAADPDPKSTAVIHKFNNKRTRFII